MRHNQVSDLTINLLTESSCKILCMYHISHLKKPDLICVGVSTIAWKKPSVTSEYFTQVQQQTSVKL